LDKPAVPVIMYHSIGIPNRKWKSNHLTCPYNIFEDQLKWLKKKKFKTINLQQLYEYMAKGTKLPKNSIVLTFDDGYLDNWVFAYPLLKKYNYLGTIYINPDFVNPRRIIRTTLDHVWNNELKVEDLATTGYLSWDELRQMGNEKIMDIQSHGMTHTWYPESEKIIDFRHPGDPYLWMTWNENPPQKPFLHMENSDLVHLGEPVYEYDKSLLIKRYFPDNKLNMHIIYYVENNGGEDFFLGNEWRKELLNQIKEYKGKNEIMDRYETEEEYKERVRYELGKSKQILEKKLDKTIKFLCWPGGGCNNTTLRIAREIGYLASTAARDLSLGKRKTMKNRYGQKPERIQRIGPVIGWNEKVGEEGRINYKNGRLFILSIYSFQQRKVLGLVSRLILAVIRRFFLIKYRLH